MPSVARNRVANMGMIGYTMSLVKKHNEVKGLPLSVREKISSAV